MCCDVCQLKYPYFLIRNTVVVNGKQNPNPIGFVLNSSEMDPNTDFSPFQVPCVV